MSYRSDIETQAGMPPAIKWLLIANGLAFVMQMARPGVFEQWLALWPNFGTTLAADPYGRILGRYPTFYPWQLITYAFLHSTISFTHIMFNMFGLWMFGQHIEHEMGWRKFLVYYFVCVIGAAATHLVYARLTGSVSPVVGASGGVFGVLLAFGMLFPHARIAIIFFPVAIEARFLVLIYGAIELVTGVTGTLSGVAHFAHLGGMLFGFIMLLIWMRPGRPIQRW